MILKEVLQNILKAIQDKIYSDGDLQHFKKVSVYILSYVQFHSWYSEKKEFVVDAISKRNAKYFKKIKATLLRMKAFKTERGFKNNEYIFLFIHYQKYFVKIKLFILK